MMTDERMTAFIDSLDRGNTPFLNEIEKYALQNQVPVIRKSMQSLLKFLLALLKPRNILEVGTAIGFSALLMSEYGPEDCHITTIEKYEKRIPLARENFRRRGAEDRITLLEGDAAELLPGLTESYDLIFMDAAKGQYIFFLPDIVRLLAPGGLLVSDNVLQDGDIIESRFAVTRRNRTIHTRMRDYLYELKHHPLLETAVLPVGDGAALSTKCERRSEDGTEAEAGAADTRRQP
ncbi:MAG: O-methyltransferase [Butyrivibrio sp.]|nr:O-methyltransferase [Acetatifactor muris]MCM1560969.1 O-methyltransferase [Butyrivibrio sp.]